MIIIMSIGISFNLHLESTFCMFPSRCVLKKWILCTVHGTCKYFFSKNNFKIEFHDTIHTFKNYFAIVFSIFNFQFSIFSFQFLVFNF